MTADDLGMRRSVQNRLGETDRIPGPRSGESARAKLRRTVYITVEADAHGGCKVRVMGEALGDDGGGPLGGRVTGTCDDLFALVERLRMTWRQRFLRFQADDDMMRRHYRFAASCDLSAHRKSPEWDDAMRELARVGFDLFQAVFLTGDPGLMEAGAKLREVLRSGPQVVSVHSDKVFIPWRMLYVPPDGEDMLDDDCPWTPEGFLGYQHDVEHVFTDRPPSFRHRLGTADGIRAGLNVDTAVDRLTPPVLEPLRELLDSVPAERLRVSWREERAQLGRALQNGSHNDQIIYFNCHGTVAGAGSDEASIALTDGHPIYTSHFRTWLAGHPLTQSPVVLINACEGGQLSSMFLDSFGLALLRAEANCLIGPQLDIPAAFAGRYAREFFRELLRGVTVGDVVRGLTRGFIEQHANPLGLVISLYRGMDTYFDVANRDDPDPEAQRILLVRDDPPGRDRTPA